METAKESYTKLKTEYESHPGYYADKYKDASGFEKALTGILGSTIATVPVVAETTAAALKEAEKKGSAEDYTAALRAEEIAKNKMNDYANSFFGSFDMIDQDELDRLTQEYQQAKEHRKSLENKHEQPVDMDSWGMKLMEESAWLKNSATENLDGIWKAGADAIIDEAQSAALLPLLLGGPKAYLAGVATNAAAENMFEQTAKGKAPHEALVSGVLTAGAEVASDEILDIKNPNPEVKVKELLKAIKFRDSELFGKFAKKLGENAKFEFTRESVRYLMEYLADELKRDPEAEFSIEKFVQSAVTNKTSDYLEKKAENLFDVLESAWKTLGE